MVVLLPVGCSDRLGDARALNASREAGLARSGGGTRTRDTAIMSRLLYRLSYPASTPPDGPATASPGYRTTAVRAPIRNRTVDLLLTMEMLCRLSYWGAAGTDFSTPAATHERTGCRGGG